MPFPTSCTHCGRKLRVQEHLAGRMVGCPGCGKAFEAHPPGVPPKPPPPDTYHAEEPVRPPAYEYGRDTDFRSSRYIDDDDDDRDEKRQRQRRKERKAAAEGAKA